MTVTAVGRTASATFTVTQGQIVLNSYSVPRQEGVLYGQALIQYRPVGSPGWTASTGATTPIQFNAVVSGYSGTSWQHEQGPNATHTRTNTGKEYRICVRIFSDNNEILASDERIYQANEPAEERSVHLALTNPSDEHVVNFKVYQDGVLLGTIAVQPKTSKSEELSVPTGSEVQVFAELVGVTKDGPAWVEQEGAVTDLGRVNAEPNNAIIPTGPGQTAPVTPIEAPKNLPTSVTPNPNKTVWKAPTGTATGLDAGTYRQGVDKLEAKLGNLEKGQTKGNQFLEEIRDKVKNMDDRDKAVRDEQIALKEANPSSSTYQSAGSSAKSAMEGIYAGKVSSASSLGYTPSGGSAPNLTVSFPAAFGGAQFNLNPFTSDRLGPLATWFRAATEWVLLIGFGAWIWLRVGEWSKGLTQAQQAKGNPVVAGTGAQATALIAAGIITAIVVVAATALLSWSFGSISFAGIAAAMSVNPLGALASGAVWMIDQLLPITTVITVAVARVSFEMWAVPLFGGVAAAVRFVVS